MTAPEGGMLSRPGECAGETRRPGRAAKAWRPSARWVLLAAAVLVLAGGAAGAWWWLRPPPAPPDPPMPQGIQEPDVRAAIEAARQAVLKEPRSAGAWGRLGMTLEAQLFEPEADRCFAEAARLDPTDPRWPYFRGLYALKYDPDHAVPLLRQALAAGRASPEDESALRLRLAEALLERRELDEAERLFREELRRRPDDPRASYGLGLVAVARGDDAAAQQYLTAARASPTARKPATAQLAALARARGDDAAADAYEKEVASMPPGSPAWPDPLVEQIARLQVGSSNQSEEVEQLEREHRWQEAANVYLRQIDEHPTTAAYIGAGRDLARLGQYDRAFGLLREAVKRDTDNARAHFSLAQALFARAEREWQQSPGDERLKDLFREAAEHARKATELKLDFAQAYLFWGLSLKYLGDPAAAVAPLRQGVACLPGDLELQLALGEALLESGQGQEARTYLENAHRLDPNDPRPPRDLERLRQKSSE